MEDIAPLFIIGFFVAFIIYEAVRPARRDLPKVARWKLKGVLFFVMTAVISSVLPFAWAGFVEKHALFHLSGLGTVWVPPAQIAVSGTLVVRPGRWVRVTVDTRPR